MGFLSDIKKSYNEEVDKQNKKSEAKISERLGGEIEGLSEVKSKWDKRGVVEYKDDNVAILRRVVGQQVEFIAAFSQLTKEGYRLMAQDEGMQAGGSVSGGVNSTYYFQKISLVS